MLTPAIYHYLLFLIIMPGEEIDVFYLTFRRFVMA